jgi:amidase
MPVMLKDVVATGDRMHTTSGALALINNDVVEDATITRRLREAGAVILGKANLSEWAGVRANGQIPGWSGRGGQTGNPYDPKMSCWGSSSGPAAAVALNYAPFAIGVETNGSIVAPAAACGIVGLKPTVGLVSRVGVMPVSMTWDSPGPMARTVADVAAVMNVIAGFDAEDPTFGDLGWASPAAAVGGSPVHEFDEVDYLEALDPDALRGARLGICWRMWGMDTDADEVVLAAIDRLKAEFDVEIVDNVSIRPLDQPEMLDGSRDMVNAEFAAGMEAFFARYTPDGPMLSLPEVAAWNEGHPDQGMEWFGQQGLVETEWALSLDDEAYLEVLDRVATVREEGVDAVLDEYELDALISPTTAVPTQIDPEGSFPGAASKLSAITGYPAITLPAGYVRGLPVGLYLAGRAFSERQLIGYAYAIEQVLQARIPVEL